METIANACEDLTPGKAAGILRAEVKPTGGNEHIPTFWSQCGYSGVSVSNRKIRFVYKFMVWEMFDVDNLDPLQLDFNSSFAASGQQPAEKLAEPGRASYVFQDRHETSLLMITHIRGPDEAVGQPSMVIASYQFSDPDSAPRARRDLLLEQATDDYREWTGGNPSISR